jgi:hypothetical protein
LCSGGVCEFEDKYFNEDVWPIIEPTCGTPDCHGNALDPTGDLLMDDMAVAYTALVGVAVADVDPKPPANCTSQVRVVAGNLNTSYLLKKLGDDQSQVCGELMPKPTVDGSSRVPLSAAQMATIRAWIQTGARQAE